MRTANTKSQVIKVEACEIISCLDINVLPSRQSQALSFAECIKMNKWLHAINEEIGPLCFIFYVRNFTSGKHEVSGLETLRMISYNIRSHDELEELIEFNAFSNEYENFEKHHASNLTCEMQNGLDSLKLTLGLIISKSA